MDLEPISLPEQTLSPLGEGAMARVYRAQHPRFGDIAIKVLRHSTADAWRRLQREATAQARLNHPNIARILGFGSFEGQPAILMQRVDGRPLDVVAGELPLEARIDLLVTVCDAVEHAHAAGLIHRDLKPGNVLVEEHEGRLHPYVLDFGLVHDNEAGSLTGAGELLGTPAYMSPEQARGDARHVDRRADVFSLGAILFQLLTGRPPFQGRSVSEVLGQIISNDAPLAHRISRSVPLALSRICAQCLERDPARRYASAAALKRDLQRWLRGERLMARPVGLRYRSTRWLRRNRLAGWAMGAALLTVLSALVWSVHARRLAIEREEQVAQLAEASESVRHRMRLLRLAPAQDLSGAVRALTREMSLLEQRASPLGDAGTPRVLRALGQAWLDLEQPARSIAALQDYLTHAPDDVDGLRLLAEARLERYRNISAALADQSSEDIARALGAEGRALLDGARQALQKAAAVDRGSPPQARAGLALLDRRFDQALQAAREYRPLDLADYSGLALEAGILAEQARFADAEGDLQQAAAINAEALQRFDAALAIGRSDGRLLEAACRAAARDILINGRRGSTPPASPDAASPACDAVVKVRPDRSEGWSARALAWAAIANSWSKANMRERERQALEAMRDDARQAAGHAGERPEPALLLARAGIRIAQLRMGGFEDSLNAYNEAIDTLEQLRMQHPRYVPALHELGIAYRQRGRLRVNFNHDPETDFDMAIEMLASARALNPDAATVADDLSLAYVFAFYHQRALDPAAARALGERAIAVLDEVLAREPDHPDLLYTQAANLADLWAYLRSLEPGDAASEHASLRERAHALAAHLREVAPQRLDGYTLAIMLELTASEIAHDRDLSDASATRRAGELIAKARDANLEVPASIEAWYATEKFRAALRVSSTLPEAELHAAREALKPALAESSDVDARMLARTTELQLAVAELQWRQRRGLPFGAVIRRGLMQYTQLLDSGRDLGDGHCDGGDILFAKAQGEQGLAQRRDAEAAVTALQSCIDSSPRANAYRRPALEAAQTLLDSTRT